MYFILLIMGKAADYGEVSQFGELHYFMPGGAALCA
jgi:hypothetical protein